MARGRGGRGGQQPVRGFRPGKEPAHLRKQRAKAQLGDDANWAQKKMIDTLGDRTPKEVRAMMKRWTAILLAIATVLAIGGALLYRWSVVAGVVVHILAIGAFFIWFRLRKQRTQFEAMADMIGGGKRR